MQQLQSPLPDGWGLHRRHVRALNSSYSVELLLPNAAQVQELQSPLRDGWGICTDGASLIVSDSSPTLAWLDPDTLQQQRTVEVHDGEAIVPWVNEVRKMSLSSFDVKLAFDEQSVAAAHRARWPSYPGSTNCPQTPSGPPNLCLPPSICVAPAQMEWVDGEIWGNVWQTECIARIDPATGAVLGWVMLQVRASVPTGCF